MKHLIALFLLLPVAGCVTPAQPTVEADSCIEDLCILSEPEPYWEDYREKFGLQQVAFTHGGDADAFQIGDGFMVFGDGKTKGGEGESDLYALDFATGKIIPFGTSDKEWAFVPRIHGNQVLFGVENKIMQGLDRFSLWMWSLENQTKWKLPIDLEGDKHPGAGFDGEWVMFSNMLRTFRAVELWAYNVEEGRLLQLFQPEPRNRHENGSYETVRTPVLHNGVAYYTVLWHHGDVSNSWTDIYATDLETNTTTHIKRLPGIQVNFMDVSSSYIVYSNDKEAWPISLNDTSSESLALPKTKETNHSPQIAEQWTFYVSRDGLVQDLISFNLETGSQKTLIQGDMEFMPGFFAIQGDDVYVGAQVINPFKDGPYYTMRVFKMGRDALP